jgi:lipoate-protein ligase A
VYHNLAWEEWALDRFEKDGPLLLFYVNDPAIVIGKNQVPWREAATGWARREGIPIARRVSGGGAVWHDAGNLNFSLVTSRAEYRQDAVLGQTIDALRDLGISASVQNGNSLIAGGRKISGTAFCFRGAAVLHHGTLLIDSDLDRLRRALRPALPGIETRAISSRPAAVANVTEFDPALTHERAMRALARRLAAASSWLESPYPEGEDSPHFLKAVEKKARASRCDSPAFEWTIVPGGPRVRCERGDVVQLELPDGRRLIERPFPFEREALARALAAFSNEWSRAALAWDW